MDRITRVTAAYGGAEGGDDMVAAAAALAGRIGAALRVASFAVRARPPYTSGVGREADAAILEQWAQEIGFAVRGALDALDDPPPQLDPVVASGESFGEALEELDWEDGDLLAVGSSPTAPLARVFLGSRASKIVRDSPVPVVVLPR